MSKYTVTLVMEVDADNDSDAALAFVDHLVDKGLRNWKYQVVDDEGKATNFNGWGDTRNPATIVAIPSFGDDDDSLIAAAELLNES